MSEESLQPRPPAPPPWWRELPRTLVKPASLTLLCLVGVGVYCWARGAPVRPGDKVMVIGPPVAVAVSEADVDRLYEHIDAGDFQGAAEMDAQGRCFLVRDTDSLLVIRRDRNHCEVRFFHSIKHTDDPNLGRVGFLPTGLVWQLNEKMLAALEQAEKAQEEGR